jgi:hypothetical protein
MRRLLAGLSVVLFASLGHTASAKDGSAVADCQSYAIRIRQASPIEMLLICGGIADALTFFTTHGLDTGVVIDVTVETFVRAGESDDFAFPVLGQFRPDANRVFMTALESQREMSRTNQVFRQDFDPRQFREVVAHEVAHVLAEHNFGVTEPSRLLHEYIAYIVQMSTMDPARRDRILAAYDAGPFGSVTEINPIVYAVAPNVFAVKAYLYFEAQPDKKAYLDRIMAEDLPAAHYSLDYFN